MAQTDTDSTSDNNVTPFPVATPEPQPRSRKRPKDPTNATRQRRHRTRRKTEQTVTAAAPVMPSSDEFSPILGEIENANKIKADVTVNDAPPLAPDINVQASRLRHGRGTDVAAYTAAVALAGAAAYFSIRGMTVLFPGAPTAIVGMTVAMEASKLVTAGWLARRWWTTARVWRGILVALVFGLAVINAAGVYAQLVAAHVGERGAATSRLEAQTADIEAKIDVQAHKVADLDRRLGQIDTTIEEAAKRGRTKTALDVMEGQKKSRGALVDERNREAGTLAALKAERASLSARGKQVETEAMPIRYVAELFGINTDSEKAIRWLIALMVLCCDPLAISITAAASARRLITV